MKITKPGIDLNFDIYLSGTCPLCDCEFECEYDEAKNRFSLCTSEEAIKRMILEKTDKYVNCPNCQCLVTPLERHKRPK